jgi:DNA-3-methyladenine glycosylase
VSLPREFYARDPRDVGLDLLNKVLRRGDRVGRIVEVEAYLGEEDPAAHSYRGPTARNATMFGPPGHLYVYFSYGMHWCCNPTCGDGRAVLVRALAPIEGVDAMRGARPAARRDADLCSGPARLTQALGIAGGDDGADLVTGDRGIVIDDDGTPPPPHPVVTTRIGITQATDEPWRFYVPGDQNVSRPLVPRVPA